MNKVQHNAMCDYLLFLCGLDNVNCNIVSPWKNGFPVPTKATPTLVGTVFTLRMAGLDMCEIRNVLKIPTWSGGEKGPMDPGFYIDEEIIEGNWEAVETVTLDEVRAVLRSRCSDFLD